MAILERSESGYKGAWLAIVLAIAMVVVGVVTVGFWLADFDAPETSGTADDGGRDIALPVEPPIGSEGPSLPEPVPAAPTSSLAELTPVDVMGNPDCVMRSGAGHGADMAVVSFPAEGGSRFAVIDGSGIIFGGTLPFHSVRDSSVGRRPDGSVLAGFGGADPPSSTSRGWQVAQPRFGPRVDGVFVYQDGHVIYENRTASRFGVANDGSSFYVIESMAGDTSRLAIRNLDSGVASYHELDGLPPVNDGNADVVRYSVDQSEVVLQPFHVAWPDRPLRFSFFPVNGDEPRQVATSYRGLSRVEFVSSNEAFSGVLHGEIKTARTEYRYEDGNVSVDERWSRDLRMGPASDDGAWLVGYGDGAAHVLDPSTGESVFVHPSAMSVNHTQHSTSIRDGRLVRGYVIADPDDIVRCRSKNPVVGKVQDWKPDGSYVERTIVDSTPQEACLADLRKRGLYRTVYDIYDLRTLTDGGTPKHYKIEYVDEPHCGSGDGLFGTLEVRDDRLVYVPR